MLNMTSQLILYKVEKMSLIFIDTWIRQIRKGVTPWSDDSQKCENDPRWTCAWALNEFYHNEHGTRDEYIMPYLVKSYDDIRRRRHKRDIYFNSWQYTEIESVNERIRIYK